MLGSPLPGRIQAQGEVWQGSPTFRVTSTFAEHVASGRGPGIDFGNGQCGAEVYACEAGQIVAASVDAGNGAVIVRIRHPQLGNVVTGYAHLQSIEVGLTSVSRGQVIGHVGRTGADACHLHWGVNIDGAEVDGWPLLDQNIMEPDVTLKGTGPHWIDNRACYLTQGGAVVDDPTVQPYRVLTSLPIGTRFAPHVEVNGNLALSTNNWYGGWVVADPPMFGYVARDVCGPLQPIETVEIPGPIPPPIIIEPEPLPPVSGVDPAPILVEVNKLTLALNDIAVARNGVTAARNRAVTIKNNIRELVGG